MYIYIPCRPSEGGGDPGALASVGVAGEGRKYSAARKERPSLLHVVVEQRTGRFRDEKGRD